MKRLNPTLPILVLSLLTCAGAMTAPSVESEQITTESLTQLKAAVFDLGGVLFEVNNNQQILQKIGWLNLISYTLRFNNPFKLRDKLLNISFDILYKMRGEKRASFPANHPHAAGLPMPSIMLKWQLGRKSSADLLAEANAFMDTLAKQHYFNNKLEEDMIRIYFDCMIDASQRVPYTGLIEEGWQLVKWFKAHDYKIYILSNMDLDTMRLSKAKFPQLFELADGVIYSGADQVMKPQPAMFQLLLKRYGLQPAECVFFDDQKENIVAAQQLGFQTFLCSRTSMATYLAQLKKQEQPPHKAALAVS